MKCKDAEHDYFKFDDATIVCHKCGDQRVVDVAALLAKLPQPIYLPCPGPHYPQPYVPWWQPNTTQPWIIYSTGTTSDPLPSGTYTINS